MNDPTLDDLQQLETWFHHHSPTAEQLVAYKEIRDSAYAFARVLLEQCPPGADRAAAMRKLREAMMTANASVACTVKQP